MNTPTREALGWDHWFADQASAQCSAAESVARVAAVDRDQLLLLNESGAFRARLAGKFLHEAPSAAELPCVGDWVCVEMIAANVDVVIVVQSCDYDFNLNRLERYLVMARDGGAAPCVLLTKTDLVEPAVVADQMAQLRTARIDVPVLTLSNVTGDGIAELQGALQSGKTYCFVGSSGVGKSTLIRDCTHTTEPGCAVLQALESGEIQAAHYENFLRLRKESEFYELSWAERRKKDKDFGRFIKSARKDLGDD